MDPRRFEEAYRAHGPSVVRYCTFTTGSWAEGEDIAAEVFVRLMTRGSALPQERIAPWLFTVARNLCATHHRRAKRAERLRTLLTPPEANQQPARVDPVLWEHVRCVDERARLIVFLHAVEGRPFSEIAELLGKSPSAVKMTHYRALARIRTSMEARGILSSADMLGGPADA